VLAEATKERRAGALALGAVLALTAAVYWRALGGELVYDDRLLIGSNPEIASLGNLPKLFTRGYWDFLDLREAQYIGYWRPLTALVQALIWPIAGSRPAPYHAACLAIHLLAVTAAYLVARRMGASVGVSGGTGLLFALHPAHVESVAWISALNDPLFGCLALFAVERFLAWRGHGSRGVPLAATVFFALALLAKELAAALVPLLLLFDLLRPQASSPSALPVPPNWPTWLRNSLAALARPSAPTRAYGPFLAAFGLYLAARMLVFASPWAGFERITTDFMVSALRLAQLRIELFGGALEILLVPLELNLFRPFRPTIAPFDPALVRAVLFSLVFAALLVAAFLRRDRLVLAGLVIVPASLLPALIRVQSLGLFPLSERFLYLPAFGFALAVALFLTRTFPKSVAGALVILLGFLFGARSATRIEVWHDEETLFRDAVRQSPRSVYVQWGLGRVLLERFSATKDPHLLTEAQQVFEQAATLLTEAKQGNTDLMVSSRDFLQVNLGLAWCAILAEDHSAAILMLQDLAQRIEKIQAEEQAARAQGIRVREQFLDLEKVYTGLAVAQYKSGHFEEAESSFRKALALQPSSAETHQNFGRMFATQGRWDEAASEFEACVKLRPGYAEDRLLLAQAWQTLGRRAEAEALARVLLEELPERNEPLIVLATGALARGDSAEALRWLARVLERDPRNGLAWYQKARALLLRNEPREAVTAFRNAVELDPNSFEAHYDFAAFLLAQGLFKEAQPYLLRAYTLAPPPHRPALRAQLQRMEFETSAELLALSEADAKNGDPAGALEWLEWAAKSAPDDVALELRRARLLRRLERTEESIAALRRCADRRPDDYEIWSELGVALHQVGRIEEARPVLERALGLAMPPGMPAELRENSRKRLREMLEAPGSPGEPPK
jgi:tetratricopeptide (TPR) repeat protein